MEILYLILVLLVVTRIFAELAERAKLPAIVGELVAGVALGFLLKRFHDSWPVLWSATQSEAYSSLVSLGMFFLMLLAGIRMEPLDFARTSKSAILVALGGMIVPVGAGLALGLIILPFLHGFLAESKLFQYVLEVIHVHVALTACHCRKADQAKKFPHVP
ncbi:MAG: cation:proton antiporter, partial [Woeseiaceae bacterium]